MNTLQFVCGVEQKHIKVFKPISSTCNKKIMNSKSGMCFNLLNVYFGY